MIDVLVLILQAALGGFIVLAMRDDDTEEIAGIKVEKFPWIVLAVALATTFAWYHAPGLVWWRYALFSAAVAWLWSDGHAWILSRPDQKLGDGKTGTRPSKYTDVALFLFGRDHADGDTLGAGPWLLASALRYLLPTIIAGATIGNVTVTASGALIIAGYYPVAWWVVPRFTTETKFVGAAIAGAVFFGAV